MKKNLYLILFIGTDGSGKTTLAKKLEVQLSVPVQYIYFGLKEFHISWLNNWVKKKGDGGIFFRLILLPIEYFMRKRSFPDYGIVILDRVPGWAFTKKSILLFRIYNFILPKANLMVHCFGDPTLINRRKPERSISECSQDLIKWEQVAQNYPSYEKIKFDTTNQSIESCLAQLNRIIRDKCKFMSSNN